MLARAPGAFVLAGLVALGACQSVDGGDRPEVALAGPQPAPPTEYPSLYTVPPRPQLSYTLEQRRAIVEGLVADRELARYTDQVVRFRSGQSDLPPPPAPPRAVAAVDTAAAIAPAPPEPESAAPALPPAPSPYDDDSGLGGFDDDDNESDTLDAFIDELARDPLEEQAGDTGVPDAPEAPAGATEGEDGGLLDWLGGLLGRDAPEAQAEGAEVATVPAMQPAPVVAQATADAPPDAVPAAGPGIAVGAEGIAIEGADAVPAAPREVATGKAASAPAGRIAFAPDSAELPADASAQLEEVLALAKARGAVIRILGEAKVPALALDRARAVGLALVRLGAGASEVEMTLAPDASGDQARLLLAGPGAL